MIQDLIRDDSGEFTFLARGKCTNKHGEHDFMELTIKKCADIATALYCSQVYTKNSGIVSSFDLETIELIGE